MNTETIIEEMINGAIEQAFTAYVTCARWADARDEDGDPIEEAEFEPRTLAAMREDVRAFLATIAEERPVDVWPLVAEEPARFGADFWLTRQGHGAGFWDGDWAEPVGLWLTDMSKAYGSQDIILCDDGRLQIS